MRGKLIPGTYLVENFKSLVANQNLGLAMANSFRNAILMTLITLLVCSIAALAIGVERTLYFRKADSGRGFTKKFCTYIEENNWDTAKHLADTTRGEIAKLATIVMAAMEIMSSWKISSATGQFWQVNMTQTLLECVEYLLSGKNGIVDDKIAQQR